MLVDEQRAAFDAVLKESGLSEDEVFELVVCAAVGQATRQYEPALSALAEAGADRETR